MSFRTMVRGGLFVLVLMAAAADVPPLPPAANIRVDFTRDVEPILKARCQVCHGPQQQMNGLRLDRGEDALQGGKSGPVILPGKSAESKLIQLVAAQKMPAVGAS